LTVNRFENSHAAVNIQVGSVAGTVSVVLERPDYRLEVLSPTPRRRTTRSQRSPSHLLDARREVVPFRGRHEQDILAAWLADEEPVSVLLVSGPGGQGKTRLAGQFATDAFRAGWAVLRAAEKLGSLRPATGLTGLRPDQCILVLVDYAERWPLAVLAELVYDLSVEYAERVVRVLLLARPQSELWEPLRAALGRSGADVPAPRNLGQFTATADDTADAYASAVEAFQEELGQPRHALAPLAGMGTSNPLSLHMRALAAVCADTEGLPPPDASNLSVYLLEHERRYWECAKLPQSVIESLVLIATLFGPFTSVREACQWIRWARLADGEAEASRLLEAHCGLYPPLPAATSVTGNDGTALVMSGELLLPLTPDRLAEDFIGTQLARAGRQELTANLLTLAGQEHDGAAVRHCLGMLAAASRYPEARAVLFDRLRARIELAEAAPPSVIYTVMEHGDRDLIEAVDAALPRFSTELLRPACDIARHLLDTLPADAPPAQRARRLNNLGTRLAETGDKQAALAHTLEAVAIHRRLVQTDPDAYLPGLAQALNNLGVRLAGVGESSEALAPTQEAAGIRRRLAETDPGAYLPGLAQALNNLGVFMAKVGNKREGLDFTEEAATIFRQLAEKDPDTYLPHLAMALWGYAWVRQVSNLESAKAVISAKEAFAIYQKLAGRFPAAYTGYVSGVQATLQRLPDTADPQEPTWVTALAPNRNLRGCYPGMLQMSILGNVSVLGLFATVVMSSLAPGPRSSRPPSERPGTVTVMTWERIAMSQMSAVSATSLPGAGGPRLPVSKTPSEPNRFSERSFDMGAALGNRTPDLRITSASLCPTELRRRAVLTDCAPQVYRFRRVCCCVAATPAAVQRIWLAPHRHSESPRVS
jgi:tetratricopeptide (TPR) repeat protein